MLKRKEKREEGKPTAMSTVTYVYSGEIYERITTNVIFYEYFRTAINIKWGVGYHINMLVYKLDENVS